MPNNPVILRVGDRPHVKQHGRRRIERIDIALTPTEDPAAETNFAGVQLVELGEYGPPFVVGLEGGSWAYGNQVDVATVDDEDDEAP